MIAVIDYGVGNLRSVEKAVCHIGGEAEVTSDPAKVDKADAVILPGVGAFAEAMRKLDEKGMIMPVRNAIARNKPFLGICLGMQLLFDYSEEAENGRGRVEGLGIFRGVIRQIPRDMGLKVPHMGWNSIRITGDSSDGSSACRLFKGLSNKPYMYFVHSYCLEAEDRDLVTAETRYGIRFDAAIGRGRVFATQFHPEKSGEAGLAVLRNFVKEVCL